MAAEFSTEPTTAVYIDDGSVEDSTGDETREWYVVPGDDFGDPTGPSVVCFSREAAFDAAEHLAEALGGLEVVCDA